MSGRLAPLGLVCLCVACARQPVAPPAPPDVLLVTIDTLRADRLTPRCMPALSLLAGRGVSFRDARSAVPLTLPAHVSIMTGAEPSRHGVHENGASRFGGSPTPLAARLRARGYLTAAFVGAFVLDRRFGLDAGFDTYDDQIVRDPTATDLLEAERPANQVVDRALAWLDAQKAGSAPFFLWVHLYDPHAPYMPPADFLARAGGRAYDGEVLFADAQLDRLLAAIDRRGDRERALVIVVGDHGESLGEHGEATHGMLLYEAALRVPLVVAGPKIAPARRDDPVSVLDILPTVLARVGIEPGATDGVDLLSGRSTPDREVRAETDYPRVAGWSPLRALVQGRWKAIASDETELYDLGTDAGETRNVATERASTAQAMRVRLGEISSAEKRGQATVPSAEAQERLRALGYVSGSQSPAGPDAGPNPARQVSAWVRFEQALGLLTRHRAADAEAGLRALAREYPDAPIFQSTWARAIAAAGEPKRALNVYRQLARRWTTDPVLFHDMAVAARDAGDAAEARRAEEAALALAPGQAAPHNGLGLLHADAGRHTEARREFAEAVRLDPTNVSYLVNLGNACRALGDLGGAEQAYRAGLDRDSRAMDALNGLGALLVQRGRPAEAVPWFERALAVDASFVPARLNLGIALQEAGETARAADQYRMVLRAPSRFAREREAAAALLKGLPR